MSNENDIKKYWDNSNIESMYDKNLMEIETQAILELLNSNDKVVDIGCGEGEGTVKYFEKVKEIVGVDYSETRLNLLKEKNPLIKTILMDMKTISLDKLGGTKFTKVITQRSLINLESFNAQKNVIKAIYNLLEDDGVYFMLEGFNEGVNMVNNLRMEFNLPSIEVKWHNCFFNENELMDFLSPYFKIEHVRDFSIYFFLTRVINAILQYPLTPRWDDELNNIAKKMEIMYKNQFIKGISRLKLLVLRKCKEKGN